MKTVLSSSYEASLQADGRSWVVETHECDDGSSERIIYLAADDEDLDLHLSTTAQQINERPDPEPAPEDPEILELQEKIDQRDLVIEFLTGVPIEQAIEDTLDLALSAQAGGTIFGIRE